MVVTKLQRCFKSVSSFYAHYCNSVSQISIFSVAFMSTPKDSWSSSSSTPTWKYDVFLSFRGKDTRNGFVSHLYAALKQKGISTFKDDVRLERGNHISSDLLEAIEKSRFAIVIFSRNYAFSRWCLDELVKIVECKKNLRTTILPVFYHVDPSDVRNQRKTFARAFVEHKSKNLNKEQMWKDALKEVANISGWHLQNRSEAEIIQKIVEMILHKLNNTFSIDTKGLIGIDSQVDKLTRLLAIGLDDVRFIGIRGMGGMGKSTLARVVYSIFSNKFEACSFIGNIREVSEKCGLLQLQQSLLFELLMERCMNIQDVDNGVLVIKNRLRHKRILLVLDDVTEIDQLNKLAGEHNWFGRGSRVVITTRDEHLLLTHKVDKIYEPTELNYNEALQLFSLKVFGKHHPAMGYLTLSKSFVQYANGVPLAIEILGSFLSNRSMEIWKNALDRLKYYPERKVIDVLQISFDGLEQTEKDIFLHIACFFNQYDKDLVEEILGCLDLYPKIGLARLIDKSLVKLHGNKLWMHDLLQQMGRDIVRRECHKEPWKRSRMWLYKDIDNVLAKNTVIDEVEGIVLNWPEPEESHWNSKGTVLEVPKPKEAHWNCEAFSKMPNLKLLVIRNVYLLHKPKHLSNGLKFLDWSGYPSKYLPSNLLPDELVGLRMCYNNIEQFWTGTKCFDKLKFIQLNESRNLIETPDFTRVPNLEKLVMEDCLKLHTVHPSMGVHRNLTVVNFKGCKSIRNLPNKFEMESLEILILSSCSKVQKLPKFMGNMERVSQLYLDGTAITKLLTSIGLLSSLVLLNTRDCKRLVCLPSTIFNLKLLKDVNLSGCSKLERLPENLGNAKSIVELNLSGTAIRQVPSSIRLLKNLKVPCFHGREGFSSSKPWYEPSLLGLYLLTELNLSYCNLRAIPDGIGCLFSLEYINLSGNSFVCLPDIISQLSNLSMMQLDDCNSLQSLPNLPLSIVSIGINGCTSLEIVQDILRPNSLCEVELFLTNCSKMVDNLVAIDMFFAVIRKHLQGLSLYGRYNDQHLDRSYEMIIPGSVIPKWFTHQSMGDEVNIKELSSHLCDEWMGVAVCVVFCYLSDHQINNYLSPLTGQLIVNEKVVSKTAGTGAVFGLTDSIWLFYLLSPYYDQEEKGITLLKECETYGFIQVGIKIEFDSSKIEVKKCGFRMVYKKDIENLNRTMAQSSNTSIIPCEDLGVLHHNFVNLAVLAEGNKAKQTSDNYDGVGPSGEGSSNNIPNPKLIERLPEFTAHGDSDCEEYWECSEELSDWHESGDSELEG